MPFEYNDEARRRACNWGLNGSEQKQGIVNEHSIVSFTDYYLIPLHQARHSIVITRTRTRTPQSLIDCELFF